MEVLELFVPECRQPERAWVADVVFRQWLGLAVRIVSRPGNEVELRLPQGKRVVWVDHFLAQADACWLEPSSMPDAGPALWEPPDERLARAIGEPQLVQWFGDGHYLRYADGIRLPIDILGSVFFLLSRYEEAVAGACQDQHGRFPGIASVAHRAGFASRPLVDEWVELLWWAMQSLVPTLSRKPRVPQLWVSCDVDAPFSPGDRGLTALLRQCAAHLATERSVKRASMTLVNATVSRFGIRRFDPFDTFEWMLDQNERLGHRVTFFFIAASRPQRIDSLHSIDEPRMVSLIESIVRRGHEIGLHGSYRSASETQLLAAELDRLKGVVSRAGGDVARIGARQHYLRWRPDLTARALDELGIEYDSTLGFADVLGFRCGTSHSFPLFDLPSRRALNLRERPLVLMEATVISRAYLGLGCSLKAHALMHRIREKCLRFGGEFSLLWHNSNFVDDRARELYRSLLQRP